MCNCISEWQIQTEDDVPDDDGDEGLLEPEVYTQNLALQRLQQNAAKRTVPVSKVRNRQPDSWLVKFRTRTYST